MGRGAGGRGVWPGISQARENVRDHRSAPDHPGKGVGTHSWGREKRGGAFADNLFQFIPLSPQKRKKKSPELGIAATALRCTVFLQGLLPLRLTLPIHTWVRIFTRGDFQFTCHLLA